MKTTAHRSDSMSYAALNTGDQNFDFSRTSQTDQGIILPLILLSLSLSLVCSCLLSMNFLHTTSLTHTITQQQRRLLDMQALRVYLQNIADAFDSHPLDTPYPLAHANIFSRRFSLQGTYAAKPATLALQAFRTQFSHALVLQALPGNNSYELCPLQSAEHTSLQTLLGVSLSGSHVYQVQAITAGGNECLRMELQRIDHPFLSSDSNETPWLFIPIVEEFAYYIDRSNTLRYLALFQGTLKENQPVRTLTITPRFLLESTDKHYSFVAAIDSQHPVRLSTRVPRVNALDLLLNITPMRNT